MTTERIDFSSKTDYSSDIFYGLEGDQFLIPQMPIPRRRSMIFDRLPVDVSPSVPFEIYASYMNPSSIHAYLIKPTIPCESLGTGLLMYYRSWFLNATSIPKGEVSMALKLPGLYAYSAVNRMTIVTTSELSDRLNDYLTML